MGSNRLLKDKIADRIVKNVFKTNAVRQKFKKILHLIDVGEMSCWPSATFGWCALTAKTITCVSSTLE